MFLILFGTCRSALRVVDHTRGTSHLILFALYHRQFANKQTNKQTRRVDVARSSNSSVVSVIGRRRVDGRHRSRLRRRRWGRARAAML